jgi:Icc-related predicted phosphoesterase
MRVQYCSDLHLEFSHNSNFLSANPLQVCGDILILAGDIIPLHDEFLNNSFFRFISKNYRQVFWVPGNHEHYYRDISDYGSSFRFTIRENIDVLNNVELQYEGVKFIFSTLWSKISETNEKYIEQNVSDFECITNNEKKFKATDFNRLHTESLEFVTQALRSSNKNTVVVTHHVPSVKCNPHVHINSCINEAFTVDITEYIEESNVNFWIYGHSHYNQKPLFIGKTIMLTNQLGYIKLNEQQGFRHNAYFSI